MEQPDPGPRKTWALRSVRRIFPRCERALAIVAFAAVWSPLLVGALGVAFVGTALGPHLDPAFGWIVEHIGWIGLGALLLTVSTLLFSGGSKSGPALAAVDRQSFYLVRGQRERRVPRGLILEGIVRPGI